MRPVHPTNRSGGWRAKRHYLHRAKRALELAEALRAPLTEAENRHAAAEAAGNPLPFEEVRISTKDVVDTHMHAEAAIMFAALSVEAFLNLYGVIRLEEGFYEKQFERLGLRAKAAAIVAACLAKILDDSDELIQVVGRIATARNGLAHPKAKEIRNDRTLPDPLPPYDVAKQAVADADRFFALFVAADPEAESLVGSA